MGLPDLEQGARALTEPWYPVLNDLDVAGLLGVVHGGTAGAAELKAAAGEAGQAVIPRMPYQRAVEGPGGLWVVRRKGNRTRWDDRPLAHAVVDVGLAAGQINHPRDAADVLLAAASVTWRVTVLRDRFKINANDYRDVSPGDLVVVPA